MPEESSEVGVIWRVTPFLPARRRPLFFGREIVFYKPDPDGYMNQPAAEITVIQRVK
jgi:hypothetical protein